MSLRDQILAIHEKRGQITPAILVDEARPEEHPLHDRFEWDDTAAGEAYRRVQAHELIRSVRVVYREADAVSPQRTVRAFHAVRSEKGGFVYEPAEKVAADPLTAQLVLREMEREWQTLKRRYEQFEEFYTMVRRDMKDAA